MTNSILNNCIGFCVLILLISSYLFFSNKKKLKNYIPGGVPNISATYATGYYYGVLGMLIAPISLIVIFLIK